MSRISGHIETHERNRYNRFRAILHMRSLWRDAAQRNLENKVLDEFELQDKRYAAALAELNAEFDEAEKLLGPYP